MQHCTKIFSLFYEFCNLLKFVFFRPVKYIFLYWNFTLSRNLCTFFLIRCCRHTVLELNLLHVDGEFRRWWNGKSDSLILIFSLLHFLCTSSLHCSMKITFSQVFHYPSRNGLGKILLIYMSQQICWPFSGRRSKTFT